MKEAVHISDLIFKAMIEDVSLTTGRESSDYRIYVRKIIEVTIQESYKGELSSSKVYISHEVQGYGCDLALRRQFIHEEVGDSYIFFVQTDKDENYYFSTPTRPILVPRNDEFTMKIDRERYKEILEEMSVYSHSN